jgi:hypothetical protein
MFACRRRQDAEKAAASPAPAADGDCEITVLDIDFVIDKFC